MKIGELAAKAGVNIQPVRFYERLRWRGAQAVESFASMVGPLGFAIAGRTKASVPTRVGVAAKEDRIFTSCKLLKPFGPALSGFKILS